MKLDEIMNKYKEIQKTPNLKKGKEGVWSFKVNNRYRLDLVKTSDEKGFFIYSSVGAITPGLEAEIYPSLLKGNLFGAETGKAVLAVEPESKTILLFQYFEEDSTSFELFNRSLEEFLSYVAYWTEKLFNPDRLKHEPQNRTPLANGRKIFLA